MGTNPRPDTKVTVVCARCGWRGKRSASTVWPACPSCGARAELIVPLRDRAPKDEGEQGRRVVH